MNYLPTCTSRLVVRHPCQVSFKSMQGCRRSWKDKLWWDGMTDKANTKCPLAILWRGHKYYIKERHKTSSLFWNVYHYNSHVLRHMPYRSDLSFTLAATTFRTCTERGSSLSTWTSVSVLRRRTPATSVWRYTKRLCYLRNCAHGIPHFLSQVCGCLILYHSCLYVLLLLPDT